MFDCVYGRFLGVQMNDRDRLPVSRSAAPGGLADGHTLYAYLPGGASGDILPASLNNIPLDFDTLQPYGCFIGSAKGFN